MTGREKGRVRALFLTDSTTPPFVGAQSLRLVKGMVARKLPVLLILAHRTGSSGPANYFGVADSSGTDISSSGGGGPSPAAGGGEGGSHGKRLPRKSSTFRTYVNNEPSVKLTALSHFSVESTSLMIAKIFGIASTPEALVRKGRAEGGGGGGLGSGGERMFLQM